MSVWFDVHNIDHCKAYRHLQKTGQWPEGFEVQDMILGRMAWQMAIMGKMVNAWIDQVLECGNYVEMNKDKR